MQIGQLAKQMAERPTKTFVTNTKKNPKEECKVIFTRRENVEKKKRIEEDVSDEEGEKKKREKGEKEKKIKVRRVVMRSQPLRPRPRAS